MLRQLSLALTTTLFVAGCATITFTPQGQAVRSVSPDLARSCNHLGLVSSWKPVMEGGLTAAQVDIRNKVGALGANAILVVSQQVDPPPYQHASIMAEAYRCDFNKDQ